MISTNRFGVGGKQLVTRHEEQNPQFILAAKLLRFLSSSYPRQVAWSLDLAQIACILNTGNIEENWKMGQY